jgi:chemotaxis protein methyltransferase CheR
MDERRLRLLELDLLLEAVYRRYGYDFRQYARASSERRTQQFLAANGFDTVSDLLARILRDEALFSRLGQYYSVSVSEFFRDPGTFRVLRERVVPLLRTWPHVKVWCAGCAGGEEAYSLAILLREEGLHGRANLYVTDFNDELLDRARQGVFPAERLQEATCNYQAAGGKGSFGDYYHARYESAVMDRSLRERITFANHNLVTDHVFGEIQLILCRNVLIYFDRELQERVLRLLTDSLSFGGFLCLGSTESLRFSEVAGCYEAVADAQRIFRKTHGNAPLPGGRPA